MIQFFLPSGPEFGVNTTATGLQDAPSIATVAGGFVVAWRSDEPSPDPEGIYLRGFDLTGAELAGLGEREIGAPGSGLGGRSALRDAASLATLADGSVLAVFEDAPSAGQIDVIGGLVDPAAPGAGIVPAGLPTTAPGFDETAPRAAAWEGGLYAVAFALAGQGTEAAALSFVDATNAAVATTTLTTGGASRAPDVAQLSGGATDGFVLAVWEEDAVAPGTGTAIRFQIFDDAGASVLPTDPAVPGAGLAGPASAPRVAPLAEGGFAIGWAEAGPGGATALFLQGFGADGVPTGPARALGASLAGQGGLDLTPTPDGGVVAVWHAGADPADPDIHAQRFDALLAPLAGPERVTATTAGAQRDAEATTLETGAVAIAWTGAGQDGDGTGVIAALFTAPEIGTTGDDDLAGTATGDRIAGASGDDTLRAGEGRDMLGGGAGDDLLAGGSWADQLAGGEGDDTVLGGAGRNSLFGDAGADTLLGGAVADMMAGGEGADLLRGFDGNDVLRGGAGDDTLDGGGWNDLLVGDAGDDHLFGRDGRDRLEGGAGDDTGFGGSGQDELRGDAGDDLLAGQRGADLLSGGDGDDSLFGGAGADSLRGENDADLLDGGGGDDLLQGGARSDTLAGGQGDDTLNGNGGNDSLDGGIGDDLLIGASGADTLDGGRGADSLTGGNGIDSFVFRAGGGADRITDFQDDRDEIALDPALWAGQGVLSAAEVVARFATVAEGDTVLSFGPDMLTVAGVTTAGDLVDDIVFAIV